MDDVCRSSFEEKHLQEYLNRVADILKISSPKYRIKSGSKCGDNYVSVIYRIFIEGEYYDGSKVKFQTIFKVPPTDEAVRKMMQVEYFFPREHLFYNEIVPIFNEFLKQKNRKSLENIPACYLSSLEDHKEVICLEDLLVKGFVMRDRIKQLDFPHISLALRTLGRLHALSFALRDQRPEIFASKIASLTETMFRPDVIADKSFSDYFEQLGDLVKIALAEENLQYTERFSDYMKEVLSKMERCYTGSAAEPYAVLCHGDFWTNNMLFKYDDEDEDEPEDICLLDFQVTRYASPVVDISYVLYCSCSRDVRSKYYDELINIYYESLSRLLSDLGSEPMKLFPYDAMLEQLKEFTVSSAGMAILVLAGITAQGEDIIPNKVNHDVIPQLKERIHRDHFWRNTLRDIFKDLIDKYLI